jgi:TonB family protein
MMFAAGPTMNPGPGNSTPAPPYPRDALARKQGGRVLLHVLVSTSGSIKDVRVVESEPQGVFDAVSIEAAKQWKLQPQLEDGKPVEGWKQVPITFEPDRKKPPSATTPGQA